MNIDYQISVGDSDTPREIFEKILASRGLKSKSAQKEFIKPEYPSLKTLIKKLKLKEESLKEAEKLIKNAVKKGEDIVIYGDYDTDGVTSTAILYKTLVDMGARTLPFIPHREKHGYGMSKIALDEILEGEAFKDSSLTPFSPKLFITTDNGIVAHEEIEYLSSKGLKVILTDHHKKEDKSPEPDVLIHTQETSAAGIAWVISLFLTKENEKSKNLIDLATIGIIADQIPLTGINRSIVVHGLNSLQDPSHKGLKQMYELSGISDKQISTYDINFIIAPRINAMGRLEDATDALRFLCTESMNQAKSLAQTLEETNKKRQDMTQEAIDLARHQVDANKLIVSSSDAFHEGVVGLIAGKLSEENGKPAIAISIGKKVAKGSARSIKGIDITALLRKSKDLLLSVGGHEMAAGFSLDPKNVGKFTDKIQELANKEIKDEDLIRSASAEAEISLSQASRELYDFLELLNPFGIGNPRPRFTTKGVSVIDSRPVGSGGIHQKMTLEKDGTTRDAIWFNAGIDPSNASEILYTIDVNSWQGRESLQLVINYAKTS